MLDCLESLSNRYNVASLELREEDERAATGGTSTARKRTVVVVVLCPVLPLMPRTSCRRPTQQRRRLLGLLKMIEVLWLDEIFGIFLFLVAGMRDGVTSEETYIQRNSLDSLYQKISYTSEET